MGMCAASGLVGATGVLGGTFDPVHVGHVRLAIEARETLGLAEVHLVPSFAPPHKAGQAVLPYPLRVALLEAACAGEVGLAVSQVERTLPAPSYTVRTVAALRRLEPGRTWVLLLGSSDFLALPSWHQGLTLPHLVDMAIVERPGTAWKEVDRFARVALGLTRTSWGWQGKRRIAYVQPPALAIASTLVRQRFLAGRSLRGLVPDACLPMLEAHRTFIQRLWRQEAS